MTPPDRCEVCERSDGTHEAWCSRIRDELIGLRLLGAIKDEDAEEIGRILREDIQ